MTPPSKINSITRMSIPASPHARPHHAQTPPRPRPAFHQRPSSVHYIGRIFQQRVHTLVLQTSLFAKNNPRAALSHPPAGCHLHTLATPSKCRHKTFVSMRQSARQGTSRQTSTERDPFERHAPEGKRGRSDARSAKARQKDESVSLRARPSVFKTKTRKKSSWPEVLPVVRRGE